jgi:hypothetical protein
MSLTKPTLSGAQPTEQKKPGAVGSILDGIINVIFGPDTAQMSEADAKKTEASRAVDQKNANSLAKSARENPGAAFMDGPTMTGGSTDIFKMVGDIVKFFGG